MKKSRIRLDLDKRPKLTKTTIVVAVRNLLGKVELRDTTAHELVEWVNKNLQLSYTLSNKVLFRIAWGVGDDAEECKFVQCTCERERCCGDDAEAFLVSTLEDLIEKTPKVAVPAEKDSFI